MSINNTAIQAERALSYTPNRVPTPKTIAIVATAVIVAVATLVAFVQTSDQESVRPTVQPAQPAQPAQTPQTFQSRDEVVRDLVNRGLIPSQSLLPASPSRDDIVQDLVDRGLVPAATFDD